MIKWLQLRKITNKIFLSQGHKDVFLRRVAIARTEHYVRWINSLKIAFNNQDKAQIQIRQNYLRGEGLIPPNNIDQCDKLIGNLRTWREM